MGCGCSAASRKIVDVTVSEDVVKKRQRARARSVVSNVSTALGIDKTIIKMPLTDRERLVLMRSWEHMHHHIVEHGVAMFVRLFESNPQVKNVFEKFSGVDSVTDMWKMEVLKIHGLSVMSAIDDIIGNMDDKDVVLELIVDQGQTHAHFGFQDDMAADIFWAIEAPFLHAVKEALQDKYNERLRNIYEKTIRFILESFVKAFKAGKAQKSLLDKEQDMKRLSVATAFDSSISWNSSIAEIR